MEMNITPIIVATLATLTVGFVWYGPLFGKAWMKENNFTEAELKNGNMLKIFGLTVLFSFFIAFFIPNFAIHQMGVFQLVGGDITNPNYITMMESHGNAFKSFKHGALHGFMASVLFAFPMIAINGLFERKSWKYIFIHSGYWAVCITLMAGIICAWK